ncbi:MAG: chromate transporter [Tenericutes bacterium HGW-Tenericutes-8]|nr:MAG: chromate transporter [Tenericutes bacterium HGW-Tenericutes-8]
MILELLKLFFVFFRIGLFTFGGGYAMIPMIRQEMLNGGYLTVDQINQFIGIAESTPGPFAVNMATFAGYHTFGILGAVFATLGVVLPSFIIILLIAYYSDRFIKTFIAQTILSFLKPVILGLILAAGLGVLLHAILGNYLETVTFDYIALIIFGVVMILSRLVKKLTPIHLVLISAFMGVILYLL